MSDVSSVSSDIQIVTTNFSPGVARENQATSVIAQEYMTTAEKARTPAEYCELGLSAAPFEYQNFLKQLQSQKLKVLDVGVGRGESSVYLAMAGHRVFSVEPGVGFCNLISYVKTKFKLDITPICAVGEEIDKIEEKDFDVVIFNSSLHHCDDPIKALKNCFSLLKSGGSIFLCSEIHLRPWVNKEQWYKRLETHPEEMGHYGGNEHAYYNWEYTKMLEAAGFTQIKRAPSGLFSNPVSRIEMDLKSKRDVLLKTHGRGYFVRLAYYFLMAKLVQINSLFQILTVTSLLPAQFQATKR